MTFEGDEHRGYGFLSNDWNDSVQLNDVDEAENLFELFRSKLLAELSMVGPVSKNTSDFLLQCIDDKSIILKDKSGPADSDVWKAFKFLWLKQSSENLNVVKCNCNALFKHNSKHGNSSLIRHLSKCSNQLKITGFAKTEQKTISSSDKENILKAQADFTNGTLSSFNINNNTSFIKFAEALISIGSKYGNISSSSVLYSGYFKFKILNLIKRIYKERNL